MVRSIALVLILLLVTNGCDTKNSVVDSSVTTSQAANSSAIFSDSLLDFEVEVVFEVGAAPYTGAIGVTSNQTWDITKASFQALFQNHVGRSVTVPITLGQMTQIPDQLKSNWSSSSLIQLGNQYAPALMSGAVAHVTVIFLNGTYNGDANILGVQFAGHPYAFVFKDVVVNAGGDAISQRYVEQASVVHELGHVIGLVNNGAPMATPHEDPSHPKHAAESNCVMSFAIESKTSVLSSLLSFISGNQLNLFGSNTLQDGRSYHP